MINIIDNHDSLLITKIYYI